MKCNNCNCEIDSNNKVFGSSICSACAFDQAVQNSSDPYEPVRPNKQSLIGSLLFGASEWRNTSPSGPQTWEEFMYDNKNR